MRPSRIVVLLSLLGALGCRAHTQVAGDAAGDHRERRTLHGKLVLGETGVLERTYELWGRDFQGSAPFAWLPDDQLNGIEGGVEPDGRTRIRVVGKPLDVPRDGNRRLIQLPLGLEVIAAHLPEELLPEEEDDEAGQQVPMATCAGRRCAPASASPSGDFQWPRPLTLDVRYRVELPDGFFVATLPAAATVPLGPALLRRGLEREGPRVIVATLSLDSGPPRITAAQREALTAALAELGEAEPITLAAEAHIEVLRHAGKYQEAHREGLRLTGATARSQLEKGSLTGARGPARRLLTPCPG